MFEKGNKLAVKHKIWTEAIKRAMRAEFGSDWEKCLTEAAKPLIKALKNGDMQAIKEVGDRLEGKPHQTSEVTINRATSLEELPTHELHRIAFGSSEDTPEAAGSKPEHNAVH